MLVVVLATACRCLQGLGACLDGDCFLNAALHALSAIDTFMIANMPHIHTAASYTGAAVVAAVFVDFHPDDIKLVEEAINCA